MGTAFPLFKVFKNAKNALDCRILHIQFQNFSGDDKPGNLQALRGLHPDTNIRLAR